MRRSEYLPTAAAALLVVAVCNRLAAQENAEHYPPVRSTSGRVGSPTRVRPAVSQSAEPTAPQSTEASVDSHHKTWKDLARGKTDARTDKQVAAFSPWSAFGALAAVVAIILVLARLFRRHAPIFAQTLPAEALEILGRRHVDPRQMILLVRIGARILIVGSSASGLNSLGQIDDPVEVDLLAGLCRRDSHAGVWGTSFFRLLKGETKTRTASRSVHSVPHSKRAAARNSINDLRSDTQPRGSGTEDLSQPEHDLIRRLRGTPASLHAETTEGVP